MAGNILLILQDPNHLRIIARTLQDTGYTVTVARRALDGLDIARRAELTLIIVDMELADLSGLELATTLRADTRFSALPIITIIDPNDNSGRELCVAAGISGFLDSPLNPQLLPLQIQFFLSGGTEGIDDPQRMDDARIRYMNDLVTRLERRIRELEETNAELERLDEMKDTFIQLTAHELRTPLTLITGYSRLLEDHPPLRNLSQRDPEIAMLIDGLSLSIGRLQGVIEEILTISRIMTKKIELNVAPTNFGAVLRKSLQTYSEALSERRLSIYFDETQFPVAIRGDEALLQQMVSNLISNAIKYTPDGGAIMFSGQTDNQRLRFSIKDTGIGVSSDMRERIFERMQIGGDIALHTTSKTSFRGGGLGLGLSICRGIVEAHGGRIWVESAGYDPQTCPGSEFIVVIPIVAQAQVRSGSAPATTSKIKKLTRNNQNV